jgi:hypothetical protein
MATGRSRLLKGPNPPFFTHLIFSSKLREENQHLKAGLVVKKEDMAGMASDDEGSIIIQPTKGNASCAACRTKESATWWKAPKGLSTNILCDSCGMGWRKYADLNVRSSREDPSPPTKVKVGENKRDGTPLSAPPAKRARVSFLLSRSRRLGHLSVSTDYSICLLYAPSQHSTATVCCVQTEWTCWQGPQVPTVWIPVSCRQVCPACINKICANYITGCCGALVEPEKIDSWVCDLCENVKTQEASLVSYHLLYSYSYSDDPSNRTRIASSVRAHHVITDKQKQTHHQTRSSARSSRPRAKTGRMSSVPCLRPRLRLRMSGDCGSSRASARSHLRGGARSVRYAMG